MSDNFNNHQMQRLEEEEDIPQSSQHHDFPDGVETPVRGHPTNMELSPSDNDQVDLTLTIQISSSIDGNIPSTVPTTANSDYIPSFFSIPAHSTGIATVTLTRAITTTSNQASIQAPAQDSSIPDQKPTNQPTRLPTIHSSVTAQSPIFTTAPTAPPMTDVPNTAIQFAVPSSNSKPRRSRIAAKFPKPPATAARQSDVTPAGSTVGQNARQLLNNSNNHGGPIPANGLRTSNATRCHLLRTLIHRLEGVRPAGSSVLGFLPHYDPYLNMVPPNVNQPPAVCSLCHTFLPPNFNAPNNKSAVLAVPSGLPPHTASPPNSNADDDETSDSDSS